MLQMREALEGNGREEEREREKEGERGEGEKGGERRSRGPFTPCFPRWLMSRLTEKRVLLKSIGFE